MTINNYFFVRMYVNMFILYTSTCITHDLSFSYFCVLFLILVEGKGDLSFWTCFQSQLLYVALKICSNQIIYIDYMGSAYEHKLFYFGTLGNTITVLLLLTAMALKMKTNPTGDSWKVNKIHSTPCSNFQTTMRTFGRLVLN